MEMRVSSVEAKNDLAIWPQGPRSEPENTNDLDHGEPVHPGFRAPQQVHVPRNRVPPEREPLKGEGPAVTNDELWQLGIEFRIIAD